MYTSMPSNYTNQPHSLGKDYRATHIHTCTGSSMVDGAYLPFKPTYCHRCNHWLKTPEAYKDHCQNHLNELDMFCGILKLRSIVVVAGRCPFCFTAPRGYGPQGRLKEFINGKVFGNHIEEHLRQLGETVHCPHPCHLVSEIQVLRDNQHE